MPPSRTDYLASSGIMAATAVVLISGRPWIALTMVGAWAVSFGLKRT